MKVYFFAICSILLVACTPPLYESEDIHPSISVITFQDSFVVNAPLHIQIKVWQRGYTGGFMLSARLEKGSCELTSNNGNIPMDGRFTPMVSSIETLTLTPKQVGELKIVFEASKISDKSSCKGSLNLLISGHPKLQITANAPTTGLINEAIEIKLLVSKLGYNGHIPVKFMQITGEGTIQFGSLIIKDNEKVSCPTNVEQILYYKPTIRGSHKFQFVTSDDYTTEFSVVEMIITN